MKEIGWIEEPFGTPLPYQSLLRSHGDISRNGVIMHPGNHLHPGSAYDERDPALLHYELLQLTGDYVRPGRNLKKLFSAYSTTARPLTTLTSSPAQRPRRSIRRGEQLTSGAIGRRSGAEDHYIHRSSEERKEH